MQNPNNRDDHQPVEQSNPEYREGQESNNTEQEQLIRSVADDTDTSDSLNTENGNIKENRL